MGPGRDPRGHVKRVVLPSGKEIEVVYFESPAESDPPQTAAARSRAMHVCPGCDSEMVHPTDWEEAGERWQVYLRCPDCEWNGGGVFSQDEVDHFDRELDRGCGLILEDLKRLIRSNMEEEAERFAAALAADQILPEDF
jgi:hypothetical protein